VAEVQHLKVRQEEVMGDVAEVSRERMKVIRGLGCISQTRFLSVPSGARF